MATRKLFNILCLESMPNISENRQIKNVFLCIQLKITLHVNGQTKKNNLTK